jgi:branched-chain amino acid transport system substrate-binding protein
MHKILVILFFSIVSFDLFGLSLPTLKDFLEDIKSRPELLDISLGNVMAPDFSKYFQEKESGYISFWKKISNWGQKENFLKNITNKKNLFSDLLEKSLIVKEKQTEIKKKFLKEDRYYIWSDLFGAYHSLIRSLDFLFDQKIMDNDFKILSSKDHFIFNGNALGMTAYNLETFLILLILKHQNPEQVFYLKGDGESENNWFDNNLFQEIEFYFQESKTKKLNIKTKISQFFKEMKCNLKILGDKENDTILFSRKIARKMTEDNEPDKAIYLNHPFIVFSGENHLFQYSRPVGLKMGVQQNSSVLWSQFSGMVPSFYHIYKYKEDSFARLVLKDDLYSSVVESFVSKGTGFDKKSYNLLTGEHSEITPIKNGNNYREIQVATTIDLTESVSVLGQRLMKGVDLCFRKTNRESLLQFKEEIGFIRNYYMNDHYTPSKTIQFLQNYVKPKNVRFILSPLGTPTVNAIKKQMQQDDYIVLFPYTGSNSFREDGRFLHYRVSYADEAIALVRHAREKLFKQNFAFFYQNDDFGLSLLRPAKKMLIEKYGLSEEAIIEAPYNRNSLAVESAAQKIKEGNPDVLIFFSTYPPSRELVNHMGVLPLQNIVLMGISFLTDRFRDYVSGVENPKLEGKGLDLILSRVVPNPETDTREIVQEYKAEMQQHYPGVRLDTDSLEGYINASLFVKIMQDLGGDISVEKVLSQGKSYKNMNYKGLKIDYDPKTSCYSKELWLDSGADIWENIQVEGQVEGASF